MLELWELGGRDDCRFSTFSWRTRLALHHKGLSFAEACAVWIHAIDRLLPPTPVS